MLLIVLLLGVFGILAALVLQKRRSASSGDEETQPVSEIKKDMDLMVQEIKSLYAEKATLVNENKKLKQEIESLKKNQN
jgi:uncharacterized protein YlxW (UPF0749 family)